MFIAYVIGVDLSDAVKYANCALEKIIDPLQLREKEHFEDLYSIAIKRFLTCDKVNDNENTGIDNSNNNIGKKINA